MQKKIFVTYTILILIGIILTGLLTLNFVRNSYVENMENKLITNASLMNQFIKEQAEKNSFEDIDFSQYANAYGGQIDARITFINKEGKVIGDSEISSTMLSEIENHSYRPEVKKALKGEVGKSERWSTTTETDYIYIAVPIKIENKIYGVTRLALPLTEMKKLNYELFQNTLIAAMCGLLVTTILGYRFVNNVAKPIKKITKTAKKIANGNFGDKVYIKSNDEIGILVETFNIMSEKLNETISEIQDKNTKLQSTLGSMNEALFAIDKSYKIILINPVAMALFHVEDEDVYGKHILEVVRNNKLHDVLKDIIHNKNVGEREVIIDYPETKILKLYTNFIRLDMDPNRIIGVMALIQDVTEMRKLENMRTEFVANVSHELKTPLTSISGFIETLKNGAMENEKVRNRFLDIIDIETERLTRLIDDLLTLSAIEKHKLNSKREEIIIKEIIDEMNIMTQSLANQKHITYSTEVEANLPPINGNRDLFKQMILNLVENAIKYTPEGGAIKVLSYKRYDNVYFVVKDTGIGIPKEHIPRLFERFYRVDKARSRKIGGTGLGLAIVKHIVLSFDGEIKVNSKLGKGSEFVVRIPIKIREKQN
ncbi:two-component system histidine kinase PnpS [Crassaminicella profunda]|uniref:two-component system histidine kinase PnpS n=1 Tax=Crassaminicella profunda TaxID=1286698 RepID=UPI001CA78E19|nr:ATP-binding protein [Crassaminicella profunda]QZY57155.1 cell wall metabolism sensor histidine kinase WalK [Crassaminicella profunda]